MTITINQITSRNFQGTGKKLDNIDVPKLAYIHNFKEDAVHAVMEVESRGSGFDDYGRPKILFEPHIFYKLLGDTPERKKAVSQGIAYKNWGEKKYPLDSYPRLIKAIALHPEKALRSASWGMMQVMGDNYKMLNYDNVFEMVWAFMEDEENHLKGGIDFIVSAKLDKPMRNLDWTSFAKGYNGPGYAKNKYPQKLLAAYNKWKKIPDVPYENFKDYLIDKKDTGDPNAIISVNSDNYDVPDEVVDDFIAPLPKPLKKGQYAEEGLTKPQIEYIQTRLRNLGYLMVGKVDGIWKKGGTTTAAISAFQEKNGLEVDGHYGPEVRKALSINDGSNVYEVSEARKNTTVKDLRMQGSRTIQSTDSSKATSLITGTGLGVMTMGSAVVDYAPQALSWLGPIKDFFGDLPIWIYGALGLVVCAVLWYQANKVQKARLDDERSGAHNGIATPAPSANNDTVSVVSSNSTLLKHPAANEVKDKDTVTVTDE